MRTRLDLEHDEADHNTKKLVLNGPESAGKSAST